MSQRRSEPRFPANLLVDVTTIGQPQADLRAVVVDASASGLRLLTTKKVSVGTVVRVDIEGIRVLGDVRYCRTEGDVSAVGIRIQ